MAINANRQALINAKVQEAVKQKIALNNSIKTNEDIEKAKTSSVSIFVDSNMSAAEKDYAYKKYSEEFLKQYYDSNGDGTITVEEFGNKETLDQTKVSGEEGNNKETAKRNGFLFAENLDIDGNGKISIDEMTYFNKVADEQDKKMDGTMSALDEAKVFIGIQGTNANDKDINRLTNKYLEGKNLDEDAAKFLDAASTKIRTKMAMDAKENYNMDFDTPADKKVYLGDIAKAETVVTTFVDESEEKEKEKDTAKDEKVETTFKNDNVYTLSGIRSNQSAQYNPYTMNGMYGGFNPYMMGGINNSFSTPVNKWQQAGNIFGSLLSGFAMIRGIFGGGFGPRWLS